ncbi:MAG: 50S ribosomal protein L4 [Patescibacteria group bacterium]
MEAPVYNLKGEKTETLKLPESVFGLKWNSDLVHQVAQSMRANKRAGTAKTKDRGEVRGGGKKPWRQKGTGRARHGSIRSPIWIGGGVTHGPTGQRKYSRKINKKAGKKAFNMILAKKLSDREILILDRIELEEAKTRRAAEILKDLSRIGGFEGLAKKGTKIIIGPENPQSVRAFRNIAGLKTIQPRNLNVLDALSARFLILGKKDFINIAK